MIKIDYKRYSLKNGLDLIIHSDKTAPTIAVSLQYKVGSSSDGEKSGMAHLFEHMMFQGSMNVDKGEHFQLIQTAGGSVNASTNNDRTEYHAKAPSDYLELLLYLESDRMGFFLPALTQEKLDNQIGVIKNERLERYDNVPYGLAYERLIKMVYGAGHPYSRPVIGYMNDIEAITIDDVRKFFVNYYNPANASLVIAGNVDYEKGRDLVEKYFAEFEGFPVEKPVAKPVKIKHERFEYEDKVGLEKIYLAWKSKNYDTKTDAKLSLLADLLTGNKNSRLSKKLVNELEIAQNVSAFNLSQLYDGMFIISATAKENKDTSEIRKYIFEEIEKIKNGGIGENELIRGKNMAKTGMIFGLEDIQNIAYSMNEYNLYEGEPDYFQRNLDIFNLVTPNELANICKMYLNDEFIELIIKPVKEN